MAGENETLDDSTSTEQLEETQTVETSDATTETEVTETPEKEVTSEAPRKFAGKYSTVEDLEEAYRRSNAEATRMAQQLSSSTKPTKTEKTVYTESQLEDWKEGRILEVANAQAAAAQAYAQGDITKAQQAEQIAKEAAKQIRMIDAELRSMSVTSTLSSEKKARAEGKLLNDAVTVLRQFKDDLVEGTDLHAKASEFMEGFVAMGMDSENTLVQAQAVSMAAQVLGLGSKKIAVDTRKQLTNTINQALKQGVVTGAGKAAGSKGSTTDFMKMSDKEFRAYKAQRGWD